MPKAAETTGGQQALKHEMVLTPLDPTLKAESNIKPVVQPQTSAESVSAQASAVSVPSSQPIPKVDTSSIYPVLGSDKIPETTQFQVEKLPDDTKTSVSGFESVLKFLRPFIAGMFGFILAGSYYHYWDGSNLNHHMRIAMDSYSPTILISTSLTTIFFIVIYGLVFRYGLRSKNSFQQALFALITSELCVVGLLGLVHLNDASLKITGSLLSPVTFLAAVLGAAIFVATYFAAVKDWTWRLSRTTLAIGCIAVLIGTDFGLSKVFSYKIEQKEKAQTVAEEKAQEKAKSGEYEFNGGYQQYYPQDLLSQRFEVTKIEAYKAIGETSIDVPHFITYTLRDTQNDREEITVWQTKTSSTLFYPPRLCGNASPMLNYMDTKDSVHVYIDTCSELRYIRAIGSLYGRDPKDISTAGSERRSKEQAKGFYEWYYNKRGNTLLTIEDKHKVLGTDGAALLLSGFEAVTPEELLAKSKALVGGNTDIVPTISYMVYTPDETLGLSLTGAYYLNKDDPANIVVFIKYDNSNSFDTIGFTISEYKRPEKFSPPNCGYESPGVGAASTVCTKVGTTKEGHAVYADGNKFWGDFGNTIIFIKGMNSKTDALKVFNSMGLTSAEKLNIQ